MNKSAIDSEWKLQNIHHPAFFSSLVARIEDALSEASSKPLAELAEKTRNLVKQGLAEAPSELLQAIRTNDEGSDLMKSYNLWQLEFAQLLLSQISARTAPDETVEEIREEKNLSILRAIWDRELTVDDIIENLWSEVDAIEFSIKRLIYLWAVYFRSNGKEGVYFLTPLGKQIIENMK